MKLCSMIVKHWGCTEDDDNEKKVGEKKEKEIK